MGPIDRRVGAALIVLLLASCGGGREDALSSTLAKPSSGAAEAGDDLVAVRLDWDRDGHLDVLTLDASTDPLVVVEALRGAPEGDAIDATQDWRGRTLEPALNQRLQLYLARSMSVGTTTDLDVLLHGARVTVTVIE